MGPFQNVRPITPDEAPSQKAKQVPGFVIEAFNRCIAREWDGAFAVVAQETILNEIDGLNPSEAPNARQAFEKGWLDVETLYEENGWDVEYDKPGFNESYPATFTFSRSPTRVGARFRGKASRI